VVWENIQLSWDITRAGMLKDEEIFVGGERSDAAPIVYSRHFPV
jgi:hypothetical protein